MAKPTPPKIAPEDIPESPSDEFERFCVRLYFRTLNSSRHLTTGSLNQAWVAFETLSAVFPLLDAGIEHKELCSGYPFPSWREETVEVPVALLRAINDGWNEYRKSETKTMGQAFGFEPFSRQGKQPMKKVSQKIDKQLYLAAQVETRYRQIGDEKARSLEDVYAEVAENSCVSRTTVERAYTAYRSVIAENLLRVRERGRIAPNTSGGGEVEE